VSASRSSVPTPVAPWTQASSSPDPHLPRLRSARCSIETSPAFAGSLRRAALVQYRMREQIHDGRPAPAPVCAARLRQRHVRSPLNDARRPPKKSDERPPTVAWSVPEWWAASNASASPARRRLFGPAAAAGPPGQNARPLPDRWNRWPRSRLVPCPQSGPAAYTIRAMGDKRSDTGRTPNSG
jgi:hypothetical protein